MPEAATTSLHVSMVCFLIKHRGNFTFNIISNLRTSVNTHNSGSEVGGAGLEGSVSIPANFKDLYIRQRSKPAGKKSSGTIALLLLKIFNS
jgi:hypothetical protein